MFTCLLIYGIYRDQSQNSGTVFYKELTLPFIPFPELDIIEGELNNVIEKVCWDLETKKFTCHIYDSYVADAEQFELHIQESTKLGWKSENI